MRLVLLFALLPLALALACCASVRPFSAIRREVPRDQFLRLGGRLVHVEQAGSGPPVVLLHGFGASTYSWRKVMPGLAASFHVVAIDFNGFGYTERTREAESYTKEGQGRLVLAVMDALGIGRAHLIGHSYGGGITLWLASRHPERVRSMVLVDSSAPSYSDTRRSRAAAFTPLTFLYIRSYVLRPAYVRKALLRSFYDDSLVTPELVQAYFDRIRIEGVVAAYRGLTIPRRTPADEVDLETIDVPALLLWGEDDEVISIAAGRRAAEELHADLVAFPKTGHVPMEERPDEWLRAVVPFLLKGKARSLTRR
jgi:pimeloyl-ACP methyl ester carboxylesterase